MPNSFVVVVDGGSGDNVLFIVLLVNVVENKRKFNRFSFKFFQFKIVRGPSPRIQGGQGSRMNNNLVVNQQRQQQNQTMPQPQAQPQSVMFVQPTYMLPHFGKFPGTNYNQVSD